MHADADQQGLVQGMITGMRGLCNGLGPAMFGLIFNLFNVNLLEVPDDGVYSPDHLRPSATVVNSTETQVEHDMDLVTQIIPGPPFVFGALLVILALMVSAFIPESFQVREECLPTYKSMLRLASFLVDSYCVAASESSNLQKGCYVFY